MFSLKDGVRRAIAVTLASVLATTVFVGCSNQNESLAEPEVTTAVTTTVVDEDVPDGINQDIADEYGNAYNTLFHWVEEPAGCELAVSTAEFLEDATQLVDENSDVYGLPVMVKESHKYLQAGNLALELTDNGEFVNEQDAKLLRYTHVPDSSTGAKIYFYRDDPNTTLTQSSLTEAHKIIARTDRFWKVLKDLVPIFHDQYALGTALAEDTVSIPDNALVWYNGIATDVRADGKMIPLDVLTDDFMNILDFKKQDDGYVFTLYTGIGEVGITATKGADAWLFKYTLPAECRITHENASLPLDSIKESDGKVFVSADVLTKVLNYFIFSFSSVDMGDGSTEDIIVIVTDNQDILQSDKDARDEAKRITEERESDAHKPSEDEIKAAEEVEKNQQDVAASYEQAVKDDPSVKNPTDSSGNLTEPAKPVEGAQKPKGSTKFTGDKSTALVTKLPEGCVWTPTPALPNAYTDAAGNLWINNKRPSDPAKDGNENAGYIDPSGDYHPTQEEIEYAEDYNRRQQEITDNPVNGEGSLDGATQAEIDELDKLFGF